MKKNSPFIEIAEMRSERLRNLSKDERVGKEC